ncbi:MAG: hypothetical protein QW367_02100 [Candidatus Aenigmatarchaeota archaeon]
MNYFMEEIEEVITFEYIREAYTAEKSENKLSKLPNDFFKKVDSYLKTKEEIFKNTQDEKVKYELKNAKRMVDEIILLRLKKIIDAVFIFLKSGSLPSNMLPKEEELFFKIIDLVKDLKKNLFESKEITKTNESNKNNLNLIENKNENKIENDEQKIERKEKDRIKVKVLTEIPKFIGPDGNWYGPYEKGSIVELEKEIANFLIDAGFVSISYT